MHACVYDVVYMQIVGYRWRCWLWCTRMHRLFVRACFRSRDRWRHLLAAAAARTETETQTDRDTESHTSDGCNSFFVQRRCGVDTLSFGHSFQTAAWASSPGSLHGWMGDGAKSQRCGPAAVCPFTRPGAASVAGRLATPLSPPSPAVANRHFECQIGQI